MKIDGTYFSPVKNVQGVGRTAQINKSKNGQGLGKDNLAVSANAQVFQNLVQKVKDLPEIREAKVKEIREQIARGEFSLDAKSIALSLLSLPGREEK
ncbi:MAG TPA: flagellar biosynthesis anti-sigma factor FlgM [Peptococcaceae bacterium]|nr:flagellar biosynthesis anti-sigma factor FlgM [Peptococcaceae bacterium]